MAIAWRRASEVSSRSSQYGTASPLPHHRFDHMIGEQKNIVKNAQEGLNQSLLILEKATTQEEINRAKLQVESLLPRCEELLTKLMVVVHVRSELDCLQKDLVKAKKNKLNLTKLYARQQWLESRLEKLVFSKRRGRPGVRLQRGHTTHQDTRLLQNRRSVQQNQLLISHKRSTTISTVSNLVEDESSFDSTSSSGDKDTSFISELQSMDKGTLHPQQYHGGGGESAYSEWNSESEANWTVMDGYSTASAKKYVQENVQGDRIEDSKEEELQNHIVRKEMIDSSHIHSNGNSSGKYEDSMQHSDVADSFPFESPRPISVFGSASWNLLCMAKYGNYMDHYKHVAQGAPEEVQKNSVLNSKLSVLWEDLMNLQQLVQMAGRVMRTEGQTLPPLPSARKLATSSSSRETRRISTTEYTVRRRQRPLSENDKGKFHDRSIVGGIPDITSENKGLVKRSKQIFPRSSLSMLHCSIDNEALLSRMKTASGTSERVPKLKWDLNMSLLLSKRKLGSRSKSARIRNLTSLVDEHLEDYKKGNVKDLISALRISDCINRRCDAAEALGHLTVDPAQEEEIISVLRNAVAHDSCTSVKHQAIRSLIKYGAWNAQLYLIVNELLSKGSTELQCDILSIMAAQNDLSCLSKITSDKEGSDDNDYAQQVLLTTLRELVTSYPVIPGETAGSDVSYSAAVILTRCGITSADIEGALRSMLPLEGPLRKAKILECLVNVYNSRDNQIIQCAYELAEKPIEWKVRLCGVQCLLSLCQQNKSTNDSNKDKLEAAIRFARNRLATEPIHVIRESLGTLLKFLGEKENTESELIRKLESTNEMIRAEAIIALSAFASGNRKVQNALMDIVDYDPSQSLKLLALSLIGKAKPLNSITLSRLQAKCTGSGPVAKQCRTVVLGAMN